MAAPENSRIEQSRTSAIGIPGTSLTVSPKLARAMPLAAPMLGANAGRCESGPPCP